jgi:predicted transcriptional regulator
VQDVTSRRNAGELEAAVLASLWATDDALVPADVQAALAAGGDDLAYSSVLTTLRRLHAKGHLTREARGRAYAYRPATSAAGAVAEHMHGLLGTGRGREVVLSQFVAALSPEDEHLLERLIAEHGSTAPRTGRGRRGRRAQ